MTIWIHDNASHYNDNLILKEMIEEGELDI